MKKDAGFFTPTRRRVLIAGGLAGAGLISSKFYSTTMAERSRTGIAFGTVVALKALHKDTALLDRALDAAWSEVVEIEHAASLFRAESALSRLNRNGRLDEAPPPLIEMLLAAREIHALTDGAFDPTVQPLWLIYDHADKEKRRATAREIENARALIGFEHVSIDAAHRSIVLAKPGMALTLNGIAQGYATQRCLSVLKEHAIADAFLDTGELGASGRHDKDHGWTAAIADPREAARAVALAQPLDGVLATSGDYATTWSADFTHHHILDPRSAESPAELASVSVLSKSGAMADGLATAMMVMGSAKSLALASRIDGVEALLVGKNGTLQSTPGFPLG